MLRFRSTLALAFVIACGSSSDDVGGTDDSGSTIPDATIDKTQNDQSASDSPAQDSPVMDSPATDSDPGDSGIADAIADVPVIKDSGIGCTSNNDCKMNEYCEKGTNNCAGSGFCNVRPQICPLLYKPVCGCDKQTHSNDCYAHASGTSVWYLSACE